MSSLNQVQIIGRLGRDVESRNFQNGGKVANLRVACTETWKDRNSGERKEKTEWVSVSIFSEGLVRVAEQYLRKGSKVFVQGKLQTRKYQDQSGQDRYSTEVVLNGFDAKLIMLDGKSNDNGGGYGGQQDSGYGSGGGGNSGYGGGYASDDIDQDAVPF